MIDKLFDLSRLDLMVLPDPHQSSMSEMLDHVENMLLNSLLYFENKKMQYSIFIHIVASSDFLVGHFVWTDILVHFFSIPAWKQEAIVSVCDGKVLVALFLMGEQGQGQEFLNSKHVFRSKSHVRLRGG